MLLFILMLVELTAACLLLVYEAEVGLASDCQYSHCIEPTKAMHINCVVC